MREGGGPVSFSESGEIPAGNNAAGGETFSVYVFPSRLKREQ